MNSEDLIDKYEKVEAEESAETRVGSDDYIITRSIYYSTVADEEFDRPVFVLMRKLRLPRRKYFTWTRDFQLQKLKSILILLYPQKVRKMLERNLLI